MPSPKNLVCLFFVSVVYMLNMLTVANNQCPLESVDQSKFPASTVPEVNELNNTAL